jgi:O-antigen ligase
MQIVNTRVKNEEASFWLLALVIICYPFSIKICNAAIILFSIHWLVWLIAEPRLFRWQNRWYITLLILPYLLLAISLVYSSNISRGLYVLEKKIPLLLFPITLGTLPLISKEKVIRLLWIACASTLAAVFLCLGFAAYRYTQGVPDSFFWVSLLKPLELHHPAYFGLCLNFLIFFLTFYLFEGHPDSKLQKIIIALISIFVVFLVLLSSKLQLVITCLMVGYFVFRYRKKISFYAFLGMAVFIAGSMAWFGTTNYALYRFGKITTLQYKIDAPPPEFNEVTIRLALLECTLEVIKKTPVIGVGAGDVDDELDKVYRELDYKFGYMDKQNPHNEYSSQLLATGLIGLITFLAILATTFTASIKRHSHVYGFFLILFALSFLFESMLEKQKGIVLYALLNALLLFHPIKINDKPSI